MKAIKTGSRLASTLRLTATTLLLGTMGQTMIACDSAAPTTLEPAPIVGDLSQTEVGKPGDVSPVGNPSNESPRQAAPRMAMKKAAIPGPREPYIPIEPAER